MKYFSKSRYHVMSEIKCLRITYIYVSFNYKHVPIMDENRDDFTKKSIAR
jgi:hypothetical protein